MAVVERKGRESRKTRTILETNLSLASLRLSTCMQMPLEVCDIGSSSEKLFPQE